MTGRAVRLAILLTALAGAGAWAASAIERFPPPDLGDDYVYPMSTQAPARAGWLGWVDVAVLAAALGVASWVVFARRSRRGVVALSIFSLAYFGFYLRGCVCPIGSIQNVALALGDSSYVVPWVVLAFFALPLVFALLFGRVFCSGVCPLGAMQDLALLRAVRVPRGLDAALRMLRWFYLGLAVLLAWAGAQFIICRYDPFVGFFRMSARLSLWVWSGGVLLLSFFVGRPYCRYLCPYGAILGLLSRVAWRKPSITPDDCIVCGLCADACPFGAIREGGVEE